MDINNKKNNTNQYVSEELYEPTNEFTLEMIPTLGLGFIFYIFFQSNFQNFLKDSDLSHWMTVLL